MIVTTINSKGKTYELTDKHIKHMETAGLLTRNVRTRLNDGWLLDDAVQAPMGTRLVDWVQHRSGERGATEVRTTTPTSGSRTTTKETAFV